MISDEKILITGGAGFIGSNMANLLSGSNSVTVLDDFSGGTLKNLVERSDKNDLKIMRGDIRNRDFFQKLDDDYDLVVHLAANSDVRAGSEDTETDMQINVIGTHNVLEFMRKKDIKQILFSSSSTVYGEADIIPTPENYGPELPISLYGASKLANEGYLWSYYHYYGIRPLIFRFANVVGRNSTHGVIHDFVLKLQKNHQELEILGDGSQEKSYIHVDDCINAMLHVYENSEKGDIINLGNDQRTSVTTIAKMLCQEMGLKDVKFKYTGGVEGRGWKGDVKVAQLSTEKIRKYGYVNRLNSDESVRLAVKEIYGQMAH
ncbi:MAG: NAD-dependent epimerase/dehydratase family protein [Cuniculiplasma sp.]